MQKRNILFFLMILVFTACGNDSSQDGNVSVEDPSKTNLPKNQTKKSVQTPIEGEITPNYEIESPLEKTQWVLTRLQADGIVHAYDQEADKVTVMNISLGRINIQGNCMSLIASYNTPEENKIVVDKFKGDSKFCAGKLGPVQRRLYNLIANADSYQMERETFLTVSSGEDQLSLRKKY